MTGLILSLSSFILAGIQISHGKDIGAIIYLAASIIFYALHIINGCVMARNANIREFFKRKKEEKSHELDFLD